MYRMNFFSVLLYTVARKHLTKFHFQKKKISTVDSSSILSLVLQRSCIPGDVFKSKTLMYFQEADHSYGNC